MKMTMLVMLIIMMIKLVMMMMMLMVMMMVLMMLAMDSAIIETTVKALNNAISSWNTIDDEYKVCMKPAPLSVCCS